MRFEGACSQGLGNLQIVEASKTQNVSAVADEPTFRVGRMRQISSGQGSVLLYVYPPLHSLRWKSDFPE